MPKYDPEANPIDGGFSISSQTTYTIFCYVCGCELGYPVIDYQIDPSTLFKPMTLEDRQKWHRESCKLEA